MLSAAPRNTLELTLTLARSREFSRKLNGGGGDEALLFLLRTTFASVARVTLSCSAASRGSRLHDHLTDLKGDAVNVSGTRAHTRARVVCGCRDVNCEIYNYYYDSKTRRHLQSRKRASPPLTTDSLTFIFVLFLGAGEKSES